MQKMSKPIIKIDVVSDVVCPWCYIGKRRLEKAIFQLKDKIDFEVEYHPFELNPDTPKEGVNHKEYLIKKFGGEARYQQLTNHVVDVAKQEGLNFNFSDATKTPNTLDAHRLIAFARKQGKQLEMKEALMSAYFEKTTDLTEPKNLIALATQLGMNAEDVKTFLESNELEAEVKMEEQLNQKRGISGVPFYINMEFLAHNQQRPLCKYLLKWEAKCQRRLKPVMLRRENVSYQIF
jgi:predicted DsbA family dithiol-disulfide isomerase